MTLTPLALAGGKMQWPLEEKIPDRVDAGLGLCVP
jgi:hypothetical protein